MIDGTSWMHREEENSLKKNRGADAKRRGKGRNRRYLLKCFSPQMPDATAGICPSPEAHSPYLLERAVRSRWGGYDPGKQSSPTRQFWLCFQGHPDRLCG